MLKELYSISSSWFGCIAVFIWFLAVVDVYIYYSFVDYLFVGLFSILQLTGIVQHVFRFSWILLVLFCFFVFFKAGNLQSLGVVFWFLYRSPCLQCPPLKLRCVQWGEREAGQEEALLRLHLQKTNKQKIPNKSSIKPLLMSWWVKLRVF